MNTSTMVKRTAGARPMPMTLLRHCFWAVVRRGDQSLIPTLIVHLPIMLQVSLVHTTRNTSSSINRAALEHDKLSTWKQQLLNYEDALTCQLLCSQQCCMLLRSIYKKGPFFFHMHVQCFSLNIASGVSNPSQLYLEVGDSEVATVKFQTPVNYVSSQIHEVQMYPQEVWCCFVSIW